MSIEQEAKTHSMGQWLFSPRTTMGRVEHLGVAGALIFMLIEISVEHFTKGLHHFTPTDWFQVAVSILMGSFLAAPLLLEIEPRNPELRTPAIIAAISFFLIAIFYIIPNKAININGIEINSAIIGTLLDLVTSTLFVLIWLNLARNETNKVKKISEKNIARFFLLLLLACAAWRVAALIGTDAQDIQSTRHLFNFLNGAALLGLYAQMLRVLNPPDPVNGLVILLYGCAQIVADLRDCLNEHDEKFCQWQTPHGFEAHTIAIILLIGKISYGLYFLYSYYAGGFRRQGDAP